MKKLMIAFGLFFLAALNMPVNAQNILDAEERNPNDFYVKDISHTRKAMPWAPVREADIVWECKVWRTIDFREKFNQFFYFPIETEKNTQGRINLVNTVLRALKNGDFEVYEDDDMEIPKDYEKIYNELNREYTTSIPIYDEYSGEEIGSRDTTFRQEFDPGEVYTISLKEAWYIDKQDTRQKVRILGMNFIYNSCKERDGENQCDPVSMFWVPMNNMSVRNALVSVPAYDENNSHSTRSYDDIFIDRYFDSFVTRMDNRMNRKVADYLTGTDAIIESQRIENEIFDIESDMWEY